MRVALWPEDTYEGHAREVERYFEGTLRMPLEVLIAVDDEGVAIGFVELNIRAYAEDCETDRVAYLEGWYVVPEMRRRGAGRALVAAAEDWAIDQGCTDFASDALITNTASAAAHLALGFSETVQLRCFKKTLMPQPGSVSGRP
jgi:aminoglycoside 6'-N-acetyltransferase I